MGKAIKLKPTRANFKLINNFQLIERDKVADILSSLGFEFADKVMVADLALENLCLIIKPTYDALFERDEELGVISKEAMLLVWPHGTPKLIPTYPLNDVSDNHPYLKIQHQKLLKQINEDDMVDIPLFIADHDMDFQDEDNVFREFDLERARKSDGSIVIICKRSIMSIAPNNYPLETEEELLDDIDLSQLKDPEMPIICTFGLAH